MKQLYKPFTRTYFFSKQGNFLLPFWGVSSCIVFCNRISYYCGPSRNFCYPENDMRKLISKAFLVMLPAIMLSRGKTIKERKLIRSTYWRRNMVATKVKHFYFLWILHTEKQRWGKWVKKPMPELHGSASCRLAFALRLQFYSYGTWSDTSKRRSLSRFSLFHIFPVQILPLFREEKR